jgi:hypothetical protein
VQESAMSSTGPKCHDAFLSYTLRGQE